MPALLEFEYNENEQKRLDITTLIVATANCRDDGENKKNTIQIQSINILCFNKINFCILQI